MYSNILYRIIQIITAWMLFAVLICGFLLYDLIDPALRNSLHANDLEGEEKEDNDNDNNDNNDDPEGLNSKTTMSTREYKSLTKIQPEIVAVPI